MLLHSIVAVHSLNGNAIGSWTENGTCWLSNPDLLPKYLPKTRILAWGYNANVLPSKGRTTSSNRILQHAQTLIAQLAADREVSPIRRSALSEHASCSLNFVQMGLIREKDRRRIEETNNLSLPLSRWNSSKTGNPSHDPCLHHAHAKYSMKRS